MVIDDTITYRQILSHVLGSFSNVEVVGTANSGKTGLMKIPSLKPDLIFLDIMMPDMDGVETLRQIKPEYPEIQVVMISAFDMNNAKATLSSLESGALDFIGKPITDSVDESINQLKQAIKPIISFIQDQKQKKSKTEAKETTLLKIKPTIIEDRVPVRPIKPRENKIEKIDVVLIGISTGGPNALFELIKSLGSKIGCPVMVVQHMPPIFTRSLAERLDGINQTVVCEAIDGQELENGTIYIAPGGKHMVLRTGDRNKLIAGITDAPPVNHCKPAVDVLFLSVAQQKRIHPLSIIMTGMGRDGTEGVLELKKNGAHCLIQDEKSSVVWGMPGSVYEADCADEILPLSQIGPRIIQLSAK